ncbi:MAG TPA: cupin domain-containing protein [Candidatus Elarobacter sp.]|jgi:uncharacterized cupin superfamily protein
MKIVNTNELEEFTWKSPRGKYRGAGKEVSEALGRDPKSTDLLLRHPFDVEILRLEPGATPYPYHAHGQQWEFYHVISGRGKVRHEGGETAIAQGDAFLFKAGEPHAMTNDGDVDLIVYVVADNPLNEANYFPDSGKWVVPLPRRQVIRGESADYMDGEE